MDKLKFGRLILVIILFSIVSACSKPSEIIPFGNLSFKEVSLMEKEQPIITKEISLSAIGDLLIHSPVYLDAMVDGGYDFMPMLEQVAPYLERSTVAIANQETMIGGEKFGLSTYPSFNSPYEVGDALKNIGVDVVSIANNHTLDRGEAVIQSAISHWETIDMMYTGAYKNEIDRENLRVYETPEGISIAFLSYTYGTNGIPVPDGKDYLVNLIDQELIASEIAKAKEEADVIALSLHFGNEYERLPNEAQKELIQFAADQGVHIVIGHHPHVLQPVEWVTGKDGNKTFAAYSLGNFLSNQQELYQRIGGVLTVKIMKTIQGEKDTIEVHSPEFLPTYVKFRPELKEYRVVPMYKLTNQDLADASAQYEEIQAHMAQWVPELKFVEE
ncbi:CapA family protein [Oceanobacillus chungangensis]|uniref:Capsular biosynthesis protein n=1 Tax=Oceanobacillus chungangensis TaxID=1229152 RepID=A0A3D8PG59_9BACI|nr:CapA family protein [Oceanobacillus chungangensis]RDW15063.1 capsular biosynthesis protein [Oceanobacillus chungangensis]